MSRKIVILFVFASLQIPLFAQHDHHHIHDEDHNYHLGIGLGGAKFLDETGFNPAFHLHFLRKINPNSNWSLGLGYEGILEDEMHSAFNILVNFRPVDFLSFNIGPGVILEKHHDETELKPGVHLESVFEFMLGDLHLGPMFGYGFDTEHHHISLGVHIGFGF